MRNKKLDGKHLLKKLHLTKNSLRRGLSLLLGLCMVASMFGGVAAFPAYAQESKQAAPQQTPAGEGFGWSIPYEEDNAAIRVRLMQRIKDGELNPFDFNAALTLEEFFVLMEMMEDGTIVSLLLPVEDAPFITEVPGGGKSDETPATTPAQPEDGGDEDGETPEAPEDGEDGEPVDPEEPGDGTGDPDETEEPETPAQPEDGENEDPADPEEPEDGETEEPEEPETPAQPDGPADEEPAVSGPVVEVPETPGMVQNYIEVPEGTVPLSAGVDYLSNMLLDTGSSEYLPRAMFMFAGVDEYAEPTNGQEDYKVLPYDNENGTDEKDYPAGLDIYNEHLVRPPKVTAWPGVELDGSKGLETVVIQKGVNAGDDTIGSDVVQGLFPGYKSYYVRRVSVQNNDINVLGAVKVGDNYIYYYTTVEGLKTEVSATTLPEGQKFIVHYATKEKHISYKVELEKADGTKEENAGGVAWVEGDDATWMEKIFGGNEELPYLTADSAYSFNVQVPVGYTLYIYVEHLGDNEEVLKRETLLGDKNDPGIREDINGGWALGSEPEWEWKQGAELSKKLDEGPDLFLTEATLYENDVNTNRRVVAVVKEKGEPQFEAFEMIRASANTKDRGTSAKQTITVGGESLAYDYLDLANFQGKYGDEPAKNDYKGYGFPNWPNIDTADGWGWSKADATSSTRAVMNKDADGTYSYQWTFQTNDSDRWILDTLAVNGVNILIPYYPKYTHNEGKGSPQATPAKVDTPDVLGSWRTTGELPDGAHVMVEYLMRFKTGNKNPQGVYRISVTGARNNVIITGMNLFQSQSGASEIAVQQLSGIRNGKDKGVEGIQYYFKGEWRTGGMAEVLVNENYTIATGGDNTLKGANFRFKLADGYADPYYILTDVDGKVVPGKENVYQTSVKCDEDGYVVYSEGGAVSERREVQLYSEAGDTLDPQYIYFDATEDGDWYYFRLTDQPVDESAEKGGLGKFVLLYVVARPTQYVVEYAGIPVNQKTGEVIQVGTDADANEISPVGLPEYTHDGHGHYPVSEGYVIDDFNSSFYDLDVNTYVSVHTARPKDANGKWSFVDWVVVDRDNKPVKDDKGNEIHYYINGSFDLNVDDVAKHARLDVEKSVYSDREVYVLRLAPCWKQIENPYTFKVAIKVLNTKGEVDTLTPDADWTSILTDFDNHDGTEELAVKIITEAKPLQDWFAQHPTYEYWDDVNTAVGTTAEDVKEAITSVVEDYIDEFVFGCSRESADFNDRVAAVLSEILPPDDENKIEFSRGGNYYYSVKQSDGTIDIWMFEKLGGLIFRKEVREEPFVYGDEFYFTVTGDLANGSYMAYPEVVYDAAGNPRAPLASDGWVVTFEGGEITSIVKNDDSVSVPTEPVTEFTLKDGEGIKLLVPAGTYTITETGSASGGSYKTEVEYVSKDDSGTPDGWKTTSGVWFGKNDPNPSATLNLAYGEHNVVETIKFINQTSAIAFEPVIAGDRTNKDTTFVYTATLTLPEGAEPLKADDGSYYFNFNLYDVEYESEPGVGQEVPAGKEEHVESGRITVTRGEETADGAVEWVTEEISLTSCQRIYIVCTVPASGKINYSIAQADQNEYRLAGQNPKTGAVAAAALGYKLFVNSKVPQLPLTGGAGVGTFWVMGTMFLLSGLGLVVLNRDLIRKRRRGVGV